MKIMVSRVEELIAEQKLTKKCLASVCGLSPQIISVTLRRGSCEPRTAGKLAHGLGVPVSEIMERREDES